MKYLWYQAGEEQPLGEYTVDEFKEVAKVKYREYAGNNNGEITIERCNNQYYYLAYPEWYSKPDTSSPPPVFAGVEVKENK